MPVDIDKSDDASETSNQPTSVKLNLDLQKLRDQWTSDKDGNQIENLEKDLDKDEGKDSEEWVAIYYFETFYLAKLVEEGNGTAKVTFLQKRPNGQFAFKRSPETGDVLLDQVFYRRIQMSMTGKASFKVDHPPLEEIKKLYSKLKKVYSEWSIQDIADLRRVVYQDDVGHKVTLADFKSLQSSMTEYEEDIMKEYYNGGNAIFHIGWSTDEVVNATMKMFERDAQSEVDFNDFEIIVIPVYSNSHWTLGVIHLKTREIRHYDSMGGDGQHFFKEARKLLTIKKIQKHEAWKFESAVTPKQKDQMSCGIIMLKMAECVCKGVQQSAHLTQCEIEISRQRIAIAIMEKAGKL